MEYKIKYGQTVYDLVLIAYNDLAYTYKFLQENPHITSIDFDLDANPGLTVTYDENFSVPEPPQFSAKNKEKSTTETITATNGQSIYDLCLMTYGDLGMIYKFMQENNIDSLNNTNLSGKVFTFNTALVSDTQVYNNIKATKKKFNTLDTTYTGKAYNKSFNISFH